MAKAKPQPDAAAYGSLPGVLFHGATPTARWPSADAVPAKVTPPLPKVGAPTARWPSADALPPVSQRPTAPPLARSSPPDRQRAEEWSLPPMSPEEPMPRLISSGTYDVILELGGGAMATVFMAVKSGSSGFRKVVALKRIHKHLANNSTFVDMLVDEARLASRINHPNVCQVLDFGCDDSGYYIAMEFLSGQSLQSVFDTISRDAALPAHPRHQLIAARIIASIAGGLHAAHSLKGDDGLPLEVVHRDITPHNLFVLHDGVPKVTDFGVARARSRIHHTTDGNLKGKLAYMAPEHISHGKVDRRADVFSLGVVFWELLTGHRLFEYRSEGETLTAVCSGNVLPPSQVQRVISPKLDQIVLRALAVKEEDRYQSARELATALESFLAQAGDTVPQVDVMAWLEDLFPGSADQAESVQRRALDASNALTISDTRPVPVLSAPRLRASLAPRPPTISGSAPVDLDLYPPASISEPPRHIPLPTLPQPQDSSPPSSDSDPLRDYIAPADAPPRSIPRPTVEAIAAALESPKQPLAPTVLRIGLASASVTLVMCGALFLFHRFIWLERAHASAHAKTVAVRAASTPSTAAGAPTPTAVASEPTPTAPVGRTIDLDDIAVGASASAKAPELTRPAPAVRAIEPAPAKSANEVAALGSVFVSTSNGSADVLVSGASVGHTPMLVSLPLGHQKLTLVPQAGGPPRNVEVDIGPNGTVMLNIPLPKPPEPAHEENPVAPPSSVDHPSIEPAL